MTEVRKSKRGRKRLGIEKRLTNVAVRFNDAELATFTELYGQAPSGEFVRNLLLSGAIPLPAPIPEINSQTYADLGRAQANLNQIAHRLNAGDDVGIKEVSEVLSEFRLRLLGV